MIPVLLIDQFTCISNQILERKKFVYNFLLKKRDRKQRISALKKKKRKSYDEPRWR